jgi:hypothetical protein
VFNAKLRDLCMDLDLPNSPFSKPDYGHGFHPEWSFVRIFRSPSGAVPLQCRNPAYLKFWQKTDAAFLHVLLRRLV